MKASLKTYFACAAAVLLVALGALAVVYGMPDNWPAGVAFGIGVLVAASASWLVHLAMKISVQSAASDEEEREDEFRRQAYHDSLTGLPNRALFDETVRRLKEKPPVNPVGVLLINVDQFKAINDSLGPKLGDKVLRAVGRRVHGALGKRDKVFRISGDEFLVMLSAADEAHTQIFANRIMGKIRRTFHVDDMQVGLTATVATAMWPADHADVEQVATSADLAMRVAKEKGSNQLVRYDSTMRSETDSRQNLLAELPNAVKRKEFSLVYQPRVNTKTGRVESFEALLRWQHPEKGLLTPDKFIHVLEDSPLIIEAGVWALETAARQVMRWHEQGHTHLSVSVNVAARQFRHHNFVRSVRNVMDRTNANPAFIELEITESQLLGDLDTAARSIEDLKLIGVTVSIDDFGTGYSSLAYLHKLPIDALKIDRSFVDAIGKGPLEGRVAQAITSLGHTLDLKVVAEGVETDQQADQLRAWGCDQMQGYKFGKPASVEDIEALLEPMQTESVLEADEESELAAQFA